MQEVSTLRLTALRGTYLLIALGMGLLIWPLILRHSLGVEHMMGVVRSMLGALTLLCALFGLRYPLKMLPLLLFELAWKTIWVLSFGLPLWSAGKLDPGTAESLRDCLVGAMLVLLVIPWGYVRAHYLAAPADPWRAPVPRTSVVPDAAA
jgi:hypothetical protein